METSMQGVNDILNDLVDVNDRITETDNLLLNNMKNFTVNLSDERAKCINLFKVLQY
jgi:hypothetical protein